jgi:acetolactate synthase-1/2/3 large subunit
MLPRETLMAEVDADTLPVFTATKYGPVSPRDVADSDLTDLADRLLAAERPLITTSYAGHTPGTSEAIERLSELIGATVVQNAMVSNVNHEMACFAGGIRGDRLPDADVGFIIDSDVPWLPSPDCPDPNAYWAHIDIDVLKTASPVWSFPANLRLEGDSSLIVNRLADLVALKRTEAQANSAASRVATLRETGDIRRGSAATAAEDPGQPAALNPHHVLRALGEFVKPDDVIFHEAVRNQPVM